MVDALIWPLAEELLSLWYFCLRGLIQFVVLDQSWAPLPPTLPLSTLNNDAVLISAVSLICLFAVNYLLLFFLVIVLSVLWCFLGGVSVISSFPSHSLLSSTVDHSGSVGSGQPLVNAIRTDSALIGGTAPLIFQRRCTLAKAESCRASFHQITFPALCQEEVTLNGLFKTNKQSWGQETRLAGRQSFGQKWWWQDNSPFKTHLKLRRHRLIPTGGLRKVNL